MDNQKLAAELEGIVAILEEKHNEVPQGAKKAAPPATLPVQQPKPKITDAYLQGQLDYVRLCVRYLTFDLKATQRECGYLRKMLEEDRDK